MYWIYALYNKEKNKIYIGQTDDLNERLSAHKDGRFKRSFTAKNRGEWELIYTEEVSDRVEALRREKQLKSYQGRVFVKSHIPR